MYRRRAVVVALVGVAFGASSVPSRSAEAGDPVPFPALPLSIAVADVDGAPVQDDTWLAGQVASSNRLFGAWGVTFDTVEVRSLEPRFTKLETRADRDALAELRKPHVINVFVVQTLRDVDDPSRYRMGVHWRKLTDLTQNYVIVAASALPTTLAHELGHYFGNGHQTVVNNLMSYRRDDGEVFLDAAQGAIIRQRAQTFLATQKLWPAEQVRSAADSAQSIGRDGGGT
jgi:hypothetical protein